MLVLSTGFPCSTVSGKRQQGILIQSRSQSPQASRSAGGRRERRWDTEIFTTEILRLLVLRVLTIYTEKPEIPVGKSNGSRHSVWKASEIMGCRSG